MSYLQEIRELLTEEQVNRFRLVFGEEIMDKVSAKKRFVVAIFQSRDSLVQWLRESTGRPLLIEGMSFDEAVAEGIVGEGSQLVERSKSLPGTFILCMAAQCFNFFTQSAGVAETYSFTLLKL